MAKSIKFNDNIYLDTSSISHKKGNTREPLNTYLNSIIESGINENGSYIKFADGTMICYGLAIINNPSFNDYYGFCQLTNMSVQTLPQEFINNNYKLVATSNVFGYFSGIVGDKLTSSFQFYGCTHKQTSEYNPGNGYFNYIAIGRWK